MSTSSSVGNRRLRADLGVEGRCFCGIKMKEKTSWTKANPGRRFLACPLTKNGAGGCGFFQWLDDPMGERACQIIPGLLRRCNKYEDEIKNCNMKIRQLERKSRILLCILILSWVILINKLSM